MGQDNITQMELWTGGINSLPFPTDVAANQYHWGENIHNRGGIPQTRYGLQLTLSIPGTKAQGITMFRPTGGLPVLVMAVDGLIYISQYPYQVFTQLPNIQFYPTADQVTFCSAVQSIKQLPNTTLVAINPTAVLIMQDGLSKAAYWDGSTSRHLNPDASAKETPTGLWMAWAGSRLWVAQGGSVFASDLEDPLRNTESQYLAERDNFQLPDDCTGMIQTADKQGLLAFTLNDTTSFQSSILDRTQWQTTPNFQQVLLPGIGCIAGKSPQNRFGLTWWFTKDGWIDFNSAMATLRDSTLYARDSEMMRSKTKIGPTATLICTALFENCALVSVPAGDIYNAHTWMQDFVVSTEGTPETAFASYSRYPAWASVWTGFRPVEWAVGPVAGNDRCFCLSQDATNYNMTNIHAWEAFNATRKDNGNRISCQFQTKLSKAQGGDYQQFKYAEVELCEVLGEVDLTIYLYGTRGGFTQIFSGRFEAEEGVFGSADNQIISFDTVIENYIPQTRKFKTDEPSAQNASTTTPLAETEMTGIIDTAFGFLFQWRGRMGVKSIQMHTMDYETRKGSTGMRNEEGKILVLTEQGVSSNS